MMVKWGSVMPSRNINLTPEMDSFIDLKIKSGQYANASEALRAGLRALEEDEQENQAKLHALRTAVQAGIAELDACYAAAATSRRASDSSCADPERRSFGLQDENVFVVLSGQMQHGPVERHEYHPLAHSQAEQVGIRNLIVAE
jgi:antitoxin ParD1/3/4